MKRIIIENFKKLFPLSILAISVAVHHPFAAFSQVKERADLLQEELVQKQKYIDKEKEVKCNQRQSSVNCRLLGDLDLSLKSIRGDLDDAAISGDLDNYSLDRIESQLVELNSELAEMPIE